MTSFHRIESRAEPKAPSAATAPNSNSKQKRLEKYIHIARGRAGPACARAYTPTVQNLRLLASRALIYARAGAGPSTRPTFRFIQGGRRPSERPILSVLTKSEGARNRQVCRLENKTLQEGAGARPAVKAPKWRRGAPR
ncbi:hypothetical protein EVAR_45956_1 [Eumeta japonica]|uniref:Uncharacterized protein n=1 Tax=Eumeta variegata TaxID=151549 RepID=A0A4C1YLM9_EUMVA|nr:hypothetical protein EVAR_45956_1 [Eumeta japonica]